MVGEAQQGGGVERARWVDISGGGGPTPKRTSCLQETGSRNSRSRTVPTAYTGMRILNVARCPREAPSAMVLG